MRYSNYFPSILIISSLFYYFSAFADFSITMLGYSSYGYGFFDMELNPFISELLKMNIPPIHMFLIPLVLIGLSFYAKYLVDKLPEERHTKRFITLKDKMLLDLQEFKYSELYIQTKISERLSWEYLFCILIVAMMGVVHLNGAFSWFYYGAF